MRCVAREQVPQGLGMYLAAPQGGGDAAPPTVVKRREAEAGE
jgi:hypothetical protein